MGKKTKRFNLEKNAKSFAEKVDGNVNDLREIENAKSAFTVTYKSKTKKINQNNTQLSHSNNWCPEDNRDFGYPNEFWSE